ncbi:MAG: hypothetical protein GC185_04695 [Alphaproteobacteria bacterium]|nr:hypothetical protein [Alphaproteobacteria bacterium]
MREQNEAQKAHAEGRHFPAPFERSICTAFLLASLPAEAVFPVCPKQQLEENARRTRRDLFEAMTGQRLSAHRNALFPRRPAAAPAEDDLLGAMRVRGHHNRKDGGAPPCFVLA